MTLSNIKMGAHRVLFFALLLAFFMLLASCHGNKALKEPSKDPLQSQYPEQTEASDPNLTVGPPTVEGDPTITPTPSPDVTPVPEVSGPDIPERETADDEFFADAAFMGNSLMDGFRLFSGLTTCDYYAATSMTVVGVDSNVCITLENGNAGTLIDGLSQKPYGKIYILLGINEIGYEVSTFIDLYGKMLDTIIAAQPDCDIYIMGLTPVSAAKSAGSDTFNMTRITSYNTALHELAAERGCYYLDLVDALAGDDGYLPANVTTDGIHFSAEVYKQWLDYIKTHYV